MIEEHESIQMRRQALDTKATMASLVVFAITTSGIAIYLYSKEDYNYLNAYLAFVFPCLAAVVAGIGLLYGEATLKPDATRARTVAWFFGSIALLFSGLLAQLYQRDDCRFLFIIVLIMLATTGFIGALVYRWRINRIVSMPGAAEKYVEVAKSRVRPIDFFYLLLSLVAGFMVAVLAVYFTEVGNSLISCQRADKAGCKENATTPTKKTTNVAANISHFATL